MEKSNSTSLDKFLDSKTEKKISESEAASIICQMSEALKFLHDQGISHRDIKLGNVLISDSGRVELIDFGFASMSFDTKLTSYCGTPCYMCPEILKKQPYVGYQADIWATGILLYRLVCGTTPFKGNPRLTRQKFRAEREYY
jgi:serine/threonine protein kinase